MDNADNKITLRELFEQHLAWHEKEHVKDARVHDDQWRGHIREHEKDALVTELRAQEHADAHKREHAASELAIKKSEDATLVKFDGVNEWRQQSKDQTSTYARADDMENRLKSQQEQVGKLENWVAINSGLPAVVANLETHMDSLDKQVTAAAGKGAGVSATIAYIVMAISVLGMLVGLYAALSGR